MSNEKYKLIGISRRNGVSANIMILSTGKVFEVGLHDLVESDMIDDFSKSEYREIYRKLYSNHDVKTVYDFADRNQKSWMTYCYICVALCVIYLLCTLAGIKPVKVYNTGIILPAAIFLYPLSFLLIDIINEFYGLSLARKAIFCALISNIIFCLSLWLVTKMTPLEQWGLDMSFNSVVHSMMSVLLASSLAYIVSENVNSYVLCKVKEITKSKLLYLRVLTSTLVAAALDSIIFVFVAFHDLLSSKVIHIMMLDQFLFKMTYAVVGILPIYGARWMFNNYINKK